MWVLEVVHSEKDEWHSHLTQWLEGGKGTAEIESRPAEQKELADLRHCPVKCCNNQYQGFTRSYDFFYIAPKILFHS